MAAKTSTALVRVGTSHGNKPQVLQLRMPRQTAATHKPKHKKHHKHHTGGKMFTEKKLLGVGVGGAAYGWIEKNYGDKIPTVPILGKAGTVALVAGELAKRKMLGSSELLMDIAIAAAAIAGYQVGKEGKIAGPVPQVMGVAAQV